MDFPIIQNSFVAGEISPSLYGRTDLDKWHNSATTARNFFVNYRGGASSRSGTKFVGACLQPFGTPPRDINFQYSLNKGYPLEFGDNIVSKTVSGAANNGSGLIRLTLSGTRGIRTGSSMVVAGVTGTTEANGSWIVTVIDSTHVDLQGSSFANAYVSGGSISGSIGYMRIKYRGDYITEDSKVISGITNANPAVINISSHGYEVGDYINISNIRGMIELNNVTWIVSSVVDSSHIQVKDIFGTVLDSTNYNTYVSGGSSSRIYTIASPYAAVDLPYLKKSQNKSTMTLCCVNMQTQKEYPPYDLKRTNDTDWSFSDAVVKTTISAPTGVSSFATSSTTKNTYYSYVVTAVDSQTNSESIASLSTSIFNNDISVNAGSNTISWNPVNGASSYKIYKAQPNTSSQVPSGSTYGYIGTTVGTEFVDRNITADFVSIPPLHYNPFANGAILSINMSSYGAGFTQDNAGYSITTSTGSGFSADPVVTGDSLMGWIINDAGSGYLSTDTISFGTKATGSIAFASVPTAGATVTINGTIFTFVSSSPTGNQVLLHSSIIDTAKALANVLSASTVAGVKTAYYYLSQNSSGAYVVNVSYKGIGTSGNSFTLAVSGSYATVSGTTLTGGSTVSTATGLISVGLNNQNYPSVVNYYQQRRVYGKTLSRPDTYFMTKPGDYTNFDYSRLSIDSDSIEGNPWAQQVNGINALQPMNQGLIALTGNGAWLVNGGSSSSITPSNQTATSQAYNGCNEIVDPIVVNLNILYIQSKGSIVRDLSYNFFSNIFTGEDITILSNHLFDYHKIKQWAYTEEPYKLVWAVRDDGVLLSLTYLKEQKVQGWTRHDTKGLFLGVCSTTEPPVDALYVITQRKINGKWIYFSERMDDRNWNNSEKCWCVDAGASTSMSYPNATIQPSASNGTSNVTSIKVVNGGSGYVSPIINIVDLTGKGIGAKANATVVGGIITHINLTSYGSDYTPGMTDVLITDSSGTGAIASASITNYVTFTTSSGVFSSANVGDIIRIGGISNQDNSSIAVYGSGKAKIVEYISSTEVVANIIDEITAVLPNDDSKTPVPVASGQWNLSTPSKVFYGFNHLEGEKINVLADGGAVMGITVTGGKITLPNEASNVVGGLGYLCQLQTIFVEPTGGGTLQGKRVSINSIYVRMESSRGIERGCNKPDQAALPNNQLADWGEMDEVPEMKPTTIMGKTPSLITDGVYLNVDGGWGEHGQVALQQKYPLPANISAIVFNFNVGDTAG